MTGCQEPRPRCDPCGTAVTGCTTDVLVPLCALQDLAVSSGTCSGRSWGREQPWSAPRAQTCHLAAVGVGPARRSPAGCLGVGAAPSPPALLFLHADVCVCTETAPPQPPPAPCSFPAPAPGLHVPPIPLAPLLPPPRPPLVPRLLSSCAGLRPPSGTAGLCSFPCRAPSAAPGSSIGSPVPRVPALNGPLSPSCVPGVARACFPQPERGLWGGCEWLPQRSSSLRIRLASRGCSSSGLPMSDSSFLG